MPGSSLSVGSLTRAPIVDYKSPRETPRTDGDCCHRQSFIRRNHHSKTPVRQEPDAGLRLRPGPDFSPCRQLPFLHKPVMRAQTQRRNRERESRESRRGEAHALVLLGGDLLQEVRDALAAGQLEAQAREEGQHTLARAMEHHVACTRQGAQLCDPVWRIRQLGEARIAGDPCGTLRAGCISPRPALELALDGACQHSRFKPTSKQEAP